tara:strand:+ start:448 stop:957 length:510 start_codon:yes stop_codon:yes gene_type:complete
VALFRFIVKHEHAIESHKSFYDNDDFEVLLMKRRQYFDVFPLNLLIAYADPPFTTEWDGIISTDGKKIVITQSKWRRADQHKKVFEFSLDDIESMTFNYTDLNLTLKNHVKGLTMSKGNFLLKYLLFYVTLTFAMFFQTYIFKGKIAKIFLENDFDNRDKFVSLLKLDD